MRKCLKALATLLDECDVLCEGCHNLVSDDEVLKKLSFKQCCRLFREIPDNEMRLMFIMKALSLKTEVWSGEEKKYLFRLAKKYGVNLKEVVSQAPSGAFFYFTLTKYRCFDSVLSRWSLLLQIKCKRTGWRAAMFPRASFSATQQTNNIVQPSSRKTGVGGIRVRSRTCFLRFPYQLLAPVFFCLSFSKKSLSSVF